MSTAAQKLIQFRPNVYEYTEASLFLSDLLSYIKLLNKTHSLRWLAHQSKVSPGYISLVIKGKRSLSKAMAEKLIPWLNLDKSEAAYLLQLVTLGKSKSQEERFEAFKKIKRFQKYQQTNSFEAESVGFLQNWYIATIKELLSHGNLKADPKLIQKELDHHVSVKNIQKTLDFLVDKKFIEINEDLSVEILKKDFFFRDGVFQIALGQHHRQMLEKAIESIDNNHKEERHLSGYSLLMNEKTYSKAVNILEKALQDIAQLEDELSEEEKKRVYHIELGAFPLTGGRKKHE